MKKTDESVAIPVLALYLLIMAVILLNKIGTQEYDIISAQFIIRWQI